MTTAMHDIEYPPPYRTVGVWLSPLPHCRGMTLSPPALLGHGSLPYRTVEA